VTKVAMNGHFSDDYHRVLMYGERSELDQTGRLEAIS
jgi:hypothetical protein